MESSITSPISSEEEDFDEAVESDPSSRYVRFKDCLRCDKFKQVYRAVDTEQGIEVAWNRISLDRFELDKDQILKEIEIFQGIRHQNIIEVYHFWIDKSKEQVVFITELLPSGTLLKFIEKSPRVRLRVIKRWCKQILQGLEFIHNRDPCIIHRDIKCDNIFINGITADGEIKIGDIGLVTFSLRTDALSIIGTPHFMAPDYYLESYSTGVDIWAFGMSILEMITWQKPYIECRDNLQRIVDKVSNFQLPMQFDAILDPAVKEFIGLCFKPQEERPSATELLQHSFFFDESEADNLPVAIDETIIALIAGNEAGDHLEESDTKKEPININFGVPVRRKSTQPNELQNGGKAPSKCNVSVVVINTATDDPDAIYIELQIETVEETFCIDFVYNLKQDKPEKVAQEMCLEMNLDDSAFEDISDIINEQVKIVHQNDLDYEDKSDSSQSTPNLIRKKSFTIKLPPKNHSNTSNTLENQSLPLPVELGNESAPEINVDASNVSAGELSLSPLHLSSDGSSGSFLANNPQYLAELPLNSPYFTDPPKYNNNDISDLTEMESLLDSSNEESDTIIDSYQSQTGMIFELDDDEIQGTDSDNKLWYPEDELQKMREKHEEAKLKLLAKQKRELEELTERLKRRKVKRSDDESSTA